jgi:sortase A
MFHKWLLGVKPPASLHKMTTALAVLLVLGGFVMISKGAYVYVKAYAAQYLLESAFAESLKSGQPVKPWAWSDTWPVARLTLPRLGASTIVLKGASGQALAFGPALLDNVPAPGEAGVSVIAAHRDTHFSFLRDVRLGDEIEVTRADGSIVWFRITDTAILPWNASGIDPHADGNWLVLSTCWPLDAMKHGDMRLVVRAQMTGRQISERMKPSTSS